MKDKICAIIAVGAGKTTACAEVGISRQTLDVWLERGEKADEDDPVFLEFYTAFTKAKERDKLTYLNSINKAAKKGDWRAAAWGLEKRYPKEFGARMEIEATVRTEPDLSQLSPEELIQWREMMEKVK